MKSPGFGAAGAQAPLESPVHRAQFRSTGTSCPCGMAGRRPLHARAGWRAGGRPAMKSPGYGAAGAQAPLESPVHRAQFRSTGISCPCGMASRIHPAQFRSTGTSCPCGMAGQRPPGDEVAAPRRNAPSTGPAGWRAGGRPAMKSPGYGAAGAQAPLKSPVHRAQFRSTGTSCPCGMAGRRPPGNEVAAPRRNAPSTGPAGFIRRTSLARALHARAG